MRKKLSTLFLCCVLCAYTATSAIYFSPSAQAATAKEKSSYTAIDLRSSSTNKEALTLALKLLKTKDSSGVSAQFMNDKKTMIAVFQDTLAACGRMGCPLTIYTLTDPAKNIWTIALDELSDALWLYKDNSKDFKIVTQAHTSDHGLSYRVYTLVGSEFIQETPKRIAPQSIENKPR